MLNSTIPLYQSVNYTNGKQRIEKLRDAHCAGKQPLPLCRIPGWGRARPLRRAEHEEQPHICRAHGDGKGMEQPWTSTGRTCCSWTGSPPPWPGCRAWNGIKKKKKSLKPRPCVSLGFYNVYISCYRFWCCQSAFSEPGWIKVWRGKTNL